MCMFLHYFVLYEDWPFSSNHSYHKEVIPVFSLSIFKANINQSGGREWVGRVGKLENTVNHF